MRKYAVGGEEPLYNPEWFQAQESQFNDFVDNYIQLNQQQPQIEPSLKEAPINEDKYESLFETMQDMLAQLQAAKEVKTQDKISQDIDEDPEFFQSLFNDDNSPINWDNYSNFKRANLNKANIGNSEQQAYDFFLNKGLSPAQSAGLVGNLSVESINFSPNVISGKTKGDNGKATGIAQWHPDRFNKVKNYVSSIGYDPYSLQGQLEGVWWELNTSEKSALNHLKYTTNPNDAAASVDRKYERSAGIHTKKRQDIASQIYNKNNG